MNDLLFENAEVIDPESRTPTGARLLVRDGRIQAALPLGERAPADAARVDLGGALLCPGFIDIHHHGSTIFHDADRMPDGLAFDSASMVRHGTTAFLATSVSGRASELRDFVTQVASTVSDARVSGALPLGVHLEGPWINPEASGAQPAGPARAFDARHETALLDCAEGAIKLVTLAPEVPGAGALLTELTRRGIVAAMGHSLASAETVNDAISRGARHVTHLFNAMGPLHHRSPGLAGTALADDRLSCDLICDGTHVHPRMVAVAARAKAEGLLLISDRIDPPPGPQRGFGSGRLRADGSVWRLPDGGLAGSRIGLDAALRNLREFAGLGLREAVAACSLRPARLLGVERERGSLRNGARADFAVLDPAALQVRETWIGGARVYAR